MLRPKKHPSHPRQAGFDPYADRRRPLAGSVALWLAGIIAVVLTQHPRPAHAAADPEASIRAFEAAALWLQDWQTPESWDLGEDAVGVWVGIRWGGRLLGEGIDLRAAPEGSASTQALPRAMRIALDQAEEAAAAEAVDRVDADDRLLALREAPTTLEVQIARDFRRIRGTSLDRVVEQFRPGLDGIYMQRGADGERAFLFPAEMLRDNQSPAQAFSWLTTQLGILTDADAAVAEGRLRIWRFEVDHLAQIRRGQPPGFLYRGTLTVPENDITRDELIHFADDLAAHLLTRRWPDSVDGVGMLGTYVAPLDQYDPLIADAADQMLTAFTMARFARHADFADSARRADAEAFALELLNAMQQRENADLEGDPSIAALAVLAASELPAETTAQLSGLLARCRDALNAVFSAETGFREDLGPAERAVCAAALGTRAALDAAWSSTDFHIQPSLLPWLGWAELELEPDQPLRSVDGLSALRSRLWAVQVELGMRTGQEADLRGGLAFMGDRPPDWNSARPLAFLATAMGDPRLTPPDQAMAELVRVAAGMRFLRQLSIREADAYRIPAPDRALGGVRLSLWSDRLPVSASAMSLLAVTEAVLALDRVAEAGNIADP